MTASATEAAIRISTDKVVPNLAAQELLDCDRTVNNGCAGGNPFNAFHYLAIRGLPPSDKYPYVEKVL